jgi:hypothetical protein
VSTIHVELVDGATGQLLGAAELPADQLPETFATSTTLHLGDDDWHVEQAAPMTREEYVAAGKLHLVIRKIERVDPKQILFSLPTLENALPPMRDGDSSAAYVLHEDDWRQLELVAARFEPEIAVELEAIRAVHAERRGVGFVRLHVRERIVEPLANVELRLDEVRAAIGGEAARRELAFSGSPGVVADAFVFVVGQGAVYGREERGRVTCLGIARGLDPTMLAPLAKAHALLIVDWCRAEIRAGADPRDI